MNYEPKIGGQKGKANYELKSKPTPAFPSINI
jgi:hypothetical protein